MLHKILWIKTSFCFENTWYYQPFFLFTKYLWLHASQCTTPISPLSKFVSAPAPFCKLHPRINHLVLLALLLGLLITRRTGIISITMLIKYWLVFQKNSHCSILCPPTNVCSHLILSFHVQPGPRDGIIQCFIKRDKSTSTYYLYLCLSPGKYQVCALFFSLISFGVTSYE